MENLLDEESPPSSQETFTDMWSCHLKFPNNHDDSSVEKLLKETYEKSKMESQHAIDDAPPLISVSSIDKLFESLNYEQDSSSTTAIAQARTSFNISALYTEEKKPIIEIKQENLKLDHSKIPANTNWQGEYGFDISFPVQEKLTKSTDWIYSEIKDKLYVNMAVICPVKFHLKKSPPNGSIIRAMPVFCQPGNMMDIVKRCINHSLPTDPLNEGHPAPKHLIRCENDNVQYIEDVDGRQSVTVPYVAPHVGMDYSTYLYKFMCLGSCVGGINRKPIQVIFTLENEGFCLGRRVLNLRICACPGRDKRSDEKQHGKFEKETKKQDDTRNAFDSFSVSNSLSRTHSHNNNEYITVKIPRCHYEIIKPMLDALDCSEILNPQQKRFLQRKQNEREGFHKSKKRKKDSSSEEEL